jgi:hypothetical protein
VTHLKDEEFLAHWKDPALFSYATEGAHLVRQLQDYVVKREAEPRVQVVLHGSTLTQLNSILC